MKNKDYWIQRQMNRDIGMEASGLDLMNNIMPIYDNALSFIESYIDSIYENYSAASGLDIEELKNTRANIEDRKRFLGALGRFQQRTDSMDVDKRYLFRLSKLEAIKEQIYESIRAIAPEEEELSTEKYKEIVREAYESQSEDIQGQLGVPKQFSIIDEDILNDILMQEWAGRNYSDSIWENVERLAGEVRDIVGGGILSGTSIPKMASKIRDRFDVGKYSATRLIRTETNFMRGQGELQSYRDDGIEEYEYVAKLDNRTSDICEELDGEVFKVSEAKVGVNYHPMHPNCRSTTVAYFISRMARRATYGQEYRDLVDKRKGRTKKGADETVGWNKGVTKQEFDTAFMLRDKKALAEMVDKIPEDYYKKFQKEIEAIIKQKNKSNKASGAQKQFREEIRNLTYE